MNYKQKLIDFCNELIEIEYREWKPMRCFRSEEQTQRDEIADKARETFKELNK